MNKVLSSVAEETLLCLTVAG